LALFLLLSSMPLFVLRAKKLRVCGEDAEAPQFYSASLAATAALAAAAASNVESASNVELAFPANLVGRGKKWGLLIP